MAFGAFDDIHEVSNFREPATLDEVHALEAEFQCELPLDYVQFITTLGRGDLNNLLRVPGPAGMRDRSGFVRELSTESFWDHPDSALSAKEIASCLYLADTDDGDNLVIVPARKPGW